MLNADSIVMRNSELIFSTLDNELLAIDAQEGYCYSLSKIAGEIWDMMETESRVSEICALLCRKYAVEPDICLADVLEVLQNLLSSGLIRVKNASA